MDRAEMKGRAPLIVAGVGAALAFGALALKSPHREPVSHGRTLTAWLREQAKDFRVPMDEAPPPDGAAANAIREIGTNAVPLLLRYLIDEPISLRWEVSKRLGGPPSWLEDPNDARRLLAWSGFQALGPAAQDAVPTLAGLLKSRDPEKRWAAAIALSYVGPAAKGSVQSLLHATEDQNLRVRTAAIWALGQIKEQPEKVVPCLEKIIDSVPVADPRRTPLLVVSLASLAKLGADASQAIPVLLRLQNDTDWTISHAAADALRRIDPAGVPDDRGRP